MFSEGELGKLFILFFSDRITILNIPKFTIGIKILLALSNSIKRKIRVTKNNRLVSILSNSSKVVVELMCNQLYHFQILLSP